MKFGRRYASDDALSHEMCSEHASNCCKCYDISEIFSTETRQATSLSKQSSECVETDISTVKKTHQSLNELMNLFFFY